MSEVIVETRDLSIRFGGVLAVNNVNFKIFSVAIFALKFLNSHNYEVVL